MSRFKKWLIGSFIGLVMIGLTGAVISRTKSLGNLKLSEYTSPTDGYSIRYPADWQTGDLDHGKVSDTKNGVFIGSLTINASLKSAKKFDDFIDQNLKPRINGVSAKYQQFEVINEQRLIREGKPAYFVEVITEQEGAQHADHTIILYIDRGNSKLTAVVMGVNENEWERNPNGYRGVIDSFKLKG